MSRKRAEATPKHMMASSTAVMEPVGTRPPRRRKGLRVLGVIIVGLVIAAIASTFFVSVLEVRGTSMEPDLQSGSYALAIRGSSFEKGDLVAFEFDNKVLIKRVVATEGDVVEIMSDGTAFINGEELEEPYATLEVVAAEGDTDNGEVDYPYTVPEGCYFVLSNDRNDISDSRNAEIGAFSEDDAIGRIVLSF